MEGVMSVLINTNVSALSTSRMLGESTQQLSNSLKRLSSGSKLISPADDVAGMAAKAGTKAAGVVIDDAAVTPKYVTGLSPKRELPIIWKIARASFFNKLVILLPVAMMNLAQPNTW